MNMVRSDMKVNFNEKSKNKEDSSSESTNGKTPQKDNKKKEGWKEQRQKLKDMMAQDKKKALAPNTGIDLARLSHK